MFTFTLKVSNKHTVISCSSFASVFALSPWIIKSLHQVAWDNLPLSSQKLVYYREQQRRRRLQKRYLKKKWIRAASNGSNVELYMCRT